MTDDDHRHTQVDANNRPPDGGLGVFRRGVAQPVPDPNRDWLRDTLERLNR